LAFEPVDPSELHHREKYDQDLITVDIARAKALSFGSTLILLKLLLLRQYWPEKN